MISKILTRLNLQTDVLPEKMNPDILHGLLAEAIAELNTKGISIMDFSEDVRHQTFLIEQQITEAVNAGDKLAFDKYLVEWKNFFFAPRGGIKRNIEKGLDI